MFSYFELLILPVLNLCLACQMFTFHFEHSYLGLAKYVIHTGGLVWDVRSDLGFLSPVEVPVWVC